ncbi:hypothetical protein AXX17_AT1G52510 [Arabidopsis thaliana]|uniref:Uncharacterized protein n=1 Tax=Arabidopsis thaliana TaxID=3702 RepID=A0A178WKL6_ARATH|nr:hypothetical protein AXX17_AT1G52510 [Arabidopsis thaliana]
MGRWIVEESSMPFFILSILRMSKVKELPDEHLPSHLTAISLKCGLEDPIHLSKANIEDMKECAWVSSIAELSIGIEWEEWIVEQGSYAPSSYSQYRCCPNLKELPDGLRFIYSLKI